MNNLMTGLLISVWSLVIIGCSATKEEPRTFPGLIGAYYGNDDFTRIKDSEILPSLNRTWTEETGHGDNWSGKWEGMLILPQNEEIVIKLEASKWTRLSLGSQTIVAGDENSQIAEVILPPIKEYSIPIKIEYRHTGDGGKFMVSWQMQGKPAEIIPERSVYFTEEQAIAWNWIPEPDPDKIDHSKFVKPVAEQVIVYYERNRFCGWPANNGIWSWGDEIAVGFSLGYYKENELHHSIDGSKPSKSVIARSLDGGKTWNLEDPENFNNGDKVKILTAPIRFTHPDFAFKSSGKRFRYSYDRGKNWQGPYEFPGFDRPKLTSRTDYIVNGDLDCHFFLSTFDDQVQARLQDHTFCVRTTDGGLTFDFLSWIGEPKNTRAVMPSSVRLSDNHLLTALRRRFDEEFPYKPRLGNNWIDVYESLDNGETWKLLSKVADTDMGKHNGNPPSMVLMKDGRICVTWGYRAVPYGIRARISNDNGKTWGDELHLRDDGREFDLGYTRSVQREDGKIITIYYISTNENYEQHIAATIWDPDLIQ
jgi:hypothetical protein